MVGGSEHRYTLPPIDIHIYNDIHKDYVKIVGKVFHPVTKEVLIHEAALPGSAFAQVKSNPRFHHTPDPKEALLKQVASQVTEKLQSQLINDLPGLSVENFDRPKYYYEKMDPDEYREAFASLYSTQASTKEDEKWLNRRVQEVIKLGV